MVAADGEKKLLCVAAIFALLLGRAMWLAPGRRGETLARGVVSFRAEKLTRMSM